MDSRKLYEMYQNIKESLNDGDTTITPEEEAIVDLWEMGERLLTERDAAKELIAALQLRLASKYHHDDIHQSRMQKILTGTTTLPAEELKQMVSASGAAE